MSKTSQPPLRYTTRNNVSPKEFARDVFSVLYLGEDVNTFTKKGLALEYGSYLAQVYTSGHASQARIAIGGCEELALFKSMPPRNRDWKPRVQAFLNRTATGEPPKTFLGNNGILNEPNGHLESKDARVYQLPDGFYLGFNTARPLVHEPFIQTNVTQISGQNAEGKHKTWNTIATSRVIIDDHEMRGVLDNVARAVGLRDHGQGLFLSAVLHNLDPSYPLPEELAAQRGATETIRTLGSTGLQGSVNQP